MSFFQPGLKYCRTKGSCAVLTQKRLAGFMLSNKVCRSSVVVPNPTKLSSLVLAVALSASVAAVWASLEFIEGKSSVAACLFWFADGSCVSAPSSELAEGLLLTVWVGSRLPLDGFLSSAFERPVSGVFLSMRDAAFDFLLAPLQYLSHRVPKQKPTKRHTAAVKSILLLDLPRTPVLHFFPLKP
jgi:hypothetical protein